MTTYLASYVVVSTHVTCLQDYVTDYAVKFPLPTTLLAPARLLPFIIDEIISHSYTFRDNTKNIRKLRLVSLPPCALQLPTMY